MSDSVFEFRQKVLLSGAISGIAAYLVLVFFPAPLSYILSGICIIIMVGSLVLVVLHEIDPYYLGGKRPPPPDLSQSDDE